MSITDCSNHSRYHLVVPRKPKEPPYVEFGKRFKILCEEAGLPTKQDELAKELGVSGSFIASVRNGKKMPSHARAINWSIKLGVCVEYLLTGRGDKYPSISPNTTKDRAIELTERLLDDLRENLLSDTDKAEINKEVNKQVDVHMGSAISNTQPRRKIVKKSK